jgi:alpha-acetolactate decarboxylase
MGGTTRVRLGALCGAALIAALAEAAWAQHATHGGPAQSIGSLPTGPHPFSIEIHGAFRDLMQRGDFSARVVLAQVMSRLPSTGVGAVSDARGEFTIIDGKLIVSYGGPQAHRAANSETAALLATARVREWQAIRVASDVAATALESFLARAAREHGLDPDQSFPFQLHGTFGPYAMHVNAAPTGGPHGMGLPMAVSVKSRGDEIGGNVAGFYVSASLVGIVTHHGERTHAHWVAADRKSTAHLDHWGIKAGTTLLLPKPE